jgi:hypothetical protein
MWSCAAFEFQAETTVPYFCIWTEEFLYKHLKYALRTVALRR